MVEEYRDAAIAQLNHALSELTAAVDTVTVRHHLDYVKTRLNQYIQTAEAALEIRAERLVAKENESQRQYEETKAAKEADLAHMKKTQVEKRQGFDFVFSGSLDRLAPLGWVWTEVWTRSGPGRGQWVWRVKNAVLDCSSTSHPVRGICKELVVAKVFTAFLGAFYRRFGKG